MLIKTNFIYMKKLKLVFHMYIKVFMDQFYLTEKYQCVPLFLKGLTHGIPLEQISIAFNYIIALITQKGVNTICWDGDAQTLISPTSTTSMPVKSFTLIIPKIYEWASANDLPLRFVYTKKERSIHNLMNHYHNETDKFGTYYGPYYFLSINNTQVVNIKYPLYNVASPNIALAASDDVKWNVLGIDMIKWFKKSGVNSGYIVYVGLGDTTKKELFKLSEYEIKDDLPLLETKVFDFERDPIP